MSRLSLGCRRRHAHVRLGFGIAWTVAAGLSCLSSPAVANPSPTEPAKAGQAVVAPQSRPDPLLAVIAIDQQSFTLYGTHGLIERTKISNGKPGKATPTGIFGVIEKKVHHMSNLYPDSAMPFMQRLTWTGYALHEGDLPGYPDSKGCIRLGWTFAKKLYEMTRLGFRVVIVPEEARAEPISHAFLPQPIWQRVPASLLGRPVQTAGLDGLAGSSTGATAVDAGIQLDPVAFAKFERERVKSELKPAADAVRAAEVAHLAAEKLAKAEAAKLKAAERRLSAAQERLEGIGFYGRLPQWGEIDRRFPEALTEHGNAERALAGARAAEAAAQAKAVAANDAHTRAEDHLEALQSRQLEMSRRQDILSILISRKDGRIYVRQGLRAVFDAPVTFRDRDEVIGHHVYVAGASVEGEKTLPWLAFSMPAEDLPIAKAQLSKDGVVARAFRHETAASALDRIELSAEIRQRLAEMVWTGASLIVTDASLNHDGTQGHDFVVFTRH